MIPELRDVALAFPPRFKVLRKLGEGAFGNVYEVFDREQQCRVALKSLERLDAHSLFRFKREFRELADIVHPNLVRLHELFCYEERWFFTMDLIRGQGFIDYVRPGIVYARDAPTLTRDQEAALPTQPAVLDAAVDGLRLRSSLPQLVEGVSALHAVGKLHRDLKPQNVLVREDGRVVILDFGLLDDINKGTLSSAGPYEVVGTPAYMAPESAAGQGDGVESDWYSVGVMLYEALTGQLPFDGRPMSMLLRKQTADPVNPEPLVSPSLRDLARLSLRLLDRDPKQRPSIEQLREASNAGLRVVVDGGLESDPARRESDPSTALITRQPAEFLIGRELQLELMHAAFGVVRDGRGVLLRVVGRSGMGKSALVRFFVDDLKRSGRAVALVGRCFECESVPYKALDSLVDALTQRLLVMGADQVSAVLPSDLAPLGRLFPVLRRVPQIADGAGDDDFEAADPHEVRRSAFGALRVLLQRLAERAPLVLWIDDLQWGDEDSAAFLVDLLQPPNAPQLLLVVSYRAEDRGTSKMLQVLEDSLASAEYEHTELEIGPLSQADCDRLASLLAGEEAEHDSHSPPPGLARESGGSPLFLMQLVRHSARAGSHATADDALPVRLDDVLWEHVCSLSEPAQRLLRAVSLAGRSIELGVVRNAAGVAEELRPSLDTLRMQRLVRTQGMRGTDLVEPYHDRIREVVAARLGADERLRIHAALAQALEATGRADPEALVLHHRSAGNTTLACKYAIIAGDRAASALAFRRAADLYRQALELDPERDTHLVRVKLADALANAGYGAEASEVYLQALPGASQSDALELRRKAAEQALRVGHVDEGISLLKDMLAAAGMALPRTPFLALVYLLLKRAWLALRGFGFRGRYDYDPEALRRIDVGWALATGLSNSDVIYGAYMQIRTLLLALGTGEPSRIARGLALEVGFSATGGRKNAARSAKLVQSSTALARKLGDNYSLGYASFGAGAAAYFEERFNDCLAHADEALRLFANCTGVSWERTTVRHYSIWSLMWLGRVREASTRVRTQLKAAIERGDLYSAADLRMFTSNMAWLAQDDVQGAREAVDEAMALWTKQGFHAQHYYALYARGQIDLYEGDGVAGLQRIQQAWPALASSMLLRVSSVYMEVHHLRARCALAAARQDPSRQAEYLRIAQADAARLAGLDSLLGPPMAELTLAAVDLMRDDQPRCECQLRAAREAFEAGGFALYACAAARRLASLPGADSQAAQMAAAATDYMQREGIADPERWTDLLAPGFEPPRRRTLTSPAT